MSSRWGVRTTNQASKVRVTLLDLQLVWALGCTPRRPHSSRPARTPSRSPPRRARLSVAAPRRPSSPARRARVRLDVGRIVNFAHPDRRRSLNSRRGPRDDAGLVAALFGLPGEGRPRAGNGAGRGPLDAGPSRSRSRRRSLSSFATRVLSTGRGTRASESGSDN